MEPTTTIITKTFIKKILAKWVITQSLNKGLTAVKNLLNSDFEQRLVSVIAKTLEEYDKKFPIVDRVGQYAFYKSNILFEKLSEHILFDKKLDETAIQEALESNPKILKPTEKQLSTFYDIFYKHINSDEKLRQLYIVENYKKRIFTVDQRLQSIEGKIDNMYDIVKQLRKIGLSTDAKEWLDRFHSDIKAFKPKTALPYLHFFEEKININEKYNKSVQAKIHYLKGLANSELLNIKSCHEEYIRAYELEPSNLKYKERAILVLIKKGDKEEAKGLIREVLEESKYNPIAWAAKCYLAEDLKKNLAKVPTIVIQKKHKSFLTFLSNFLADETLFYISDKYFKEEFEQFQLPKEINFENKSYWITVSSLLFFSVDREMSYSYLKPNPVIQKNPNLKKAITLTEFLLHFFEHTERESLIFILKCRLEYCKYLLTGSDDSVDNLLEIIGSLEKENRIKAFPLIVLPLLQKERFEKVVEITKGKQSEVPPIVLPMIAFAYSKVGNYEMANQTTKNYIQKITIIDEKNLSHILIYFDYFSEEKERKKAFKNLVESKKITHKGYELILKFACYKSFESKEVLTTILDKALAVLHQSDVYLKKKIAHGYLMIRAFDKAVKTYESFIDVTQYSHELESYIVSLLMSNSDNIKLLELLENWRKIGDTTEQDFLIHEINLLSETREWNQVEEVAQIGIKFFPKNHHFLHALILSFHKQKKKEETEIWINKIINEKTTLAFEIALNIAELALLEGKLELSLQLLYPIADDIHNIAARESYYYTFGLQLDTSALPIINQVNDDCYVVVKFDDKTELIRINQTSLQYNPIVKSIQGKTVGDICKISISYFKESKEVEIIQVIDKYQGLIKEIKKDLAADKIDAYKVKTGEKANETINEQSNKIFGINGKILKEVRKNLHENYLKYEIAFSDLVKNLGYNPFQVYNSLTRSNNKGLVVIPFNYFAEYNLGKTKEFVIDITSVLLFYNLSQKFGLAFKEKFWISKALIELIEKELYETLYQEEMQMAVQITKEGVIPYLLAKKENKKANIDYLKNLLNWIDKNCQTKPVREKLNFLTKFRAKGGDKTAYTDAVFDTLFLASESNFVLIADDTIYYSTLYQEKLQVSTEYFLAKKFPIQYSSQILPFLLANNYREIRIIRATLFGEFKKYLNKEENLFHKCLENISLFNNQGSGLLNLIIELVKNVYLSPDLVSEIKPILVQFIFERLLKDTPREPYFYNLVNESLKQHFNLVPIQLQRAQEDFKEAWTKFSGF